MSDLNLGRLEGKVNKTPVSRQFNKQFDLEKVSMSEVVLNDDNEILSVSNGYITDATGRYFGEFNVTGQYILPDADNRTLNISIPFVVYNTVLDRIKTVLNELESNDFDEVDEYTAEKLARLAAEQAEAERLENEQNTTEVVTPQENPNVGDTSYPGNE